MSFSTFTASISGLSSNNPVRTRVVHDGIKTNQVRKQGVCLYHKSKRTACAIQCPHLGHDESGNLAWFANNTKVKKVASKRGYQALMQHGRFSKRPTRKVSKTIRSAFGTYYQLNGENDPLMSSLENSSQHCRLKHVDDAHVISPAPASISSSSDRLSGLSGLIGCVRGDDDKYASDPYHDSAYTYTASHHPIDNIGCVASANRDKCIDCKMLNDLDYQLLLPSTMIDSNYHTFIRIMTVTPQSMDEFIAACESPSVHSDILEPTTSNDLDLLVPSSPWSTPRHVSCMKSSSPSFDSTFTCSLEHDEEYYSITMDVETNDNNHESSVPVSESSPINIRMCTTSPRRPDHETSTSSGAADHFTKAYCSPHNNLSMTTHQSSPNSLALPTTPQTPSTLSFVACTNVQSLGIYTPLVKSPSFVQDTPWQNQY